MPGIVDIFLISMINGNLIIGHFLIFLKSIFYTNIRNFS